MWKISAAFIVFAAVALFIIFKAGDKVDMQGEGAGHNTSEVQSASASGPSATAAEQPSNSASK